MKRSIELAAEYKRFGVANGFGETSIHKDLLSVLSEGFGSSDCGCYGPAKPRPDWGKWIDPHRRV
ncbi:MAG: hypothetical protein JO266_07710 [Acidobacteria bacterium]|nr:hypothetical protein [Acidobacteriota bacterium]